MQSKPADHSGWVFTAVGLVASGIAVLPMPYGYYTAIKGYFFFSLIAATCHCVSREGWRNWFLVAGAVAIAVNNPIWPPEFPKWLWTLTNFGSAACFMLIYGGAPDLVMDQTRKHR